MYLCNVVVIRDFVFECSNTKAKHSTTNIDYRCIRDKNQWTKNKYRTRRYFAVIVVLESKDNIE